MNTRTKLSLGSLVALILVGISYGLLREDPKTAHERTEDASASVPSQSASEVASAPVFVSNDEDGGAVGDGAARTTARVSARWGGGLGELGRDKPQEGNPEGPMSFAPAGDDLVVVDQVNGRVSRYDKNGRLERSSDIPRTVQDVAVGADGSMALLDRLAEKKVTLLDPNGHKIGELPLDERRVGETGLVTGVFVDGKNVYAEKEHGALVLLGTTGGQPPADGAEELVGRPSKDGALLLSATLQVPRAQAFVNAFDRKLGALRFAHAVGFSRAVRAIALLDTDKQGTIYLGVAAKNEPEVDVACLSPADGHVLGRVTLPLSEGAEEAFRDFAVADDGAIVFALRTEQGVEYRSARCP